MRRSPTVVPSQALLLFALLALMLGFLLTASIVLLPHKAYAQSSQSGIVTYPAVGPYNGFLDQMNIYECVNSGAKEVTVQLELFRNNGNRLTTVSRKISAGGGTEHFILNELRDSNGEGIANDYGVVVVSVPGETSPQVNCLPAFYRLSPQHAVEYAYAIPLSNPATGSTFGIFNSYDPSGKNQNITDNWLTIYNPSSSAPFSGEVKTYEVAPSGQTTTTTQIITLQPYQRFDLYLGHSGQQSTGLYEVRPTGTTTGYQSFLNRYQRNDHGSYNYAFSLANTAGKCGQQLNASTMGNAHNWLEMANPTATAAPITIEVRDRDGLIIHTQSATITGFSQLHVYLNQYIDPTAQGNVGTVRVRCNAASQKLLVQSAFYGRDRSDIQDISWAYVSQANTALYATTGSSVVGTTNTFLGAANWLKLINTSISPAAVNIFGLNNQGATTFHQLNNLASRAGADVAIHELVGADKAGSAILFSTTPGISYTGEILRVYLNSAGGIDYVMPTPLVVLNNGLEAPIDDLRPVANSQTVTVGEKAGVNITLSGSDPNGRALTYRLISSPPYGTVTGTPPSIRFTAGFARGTETFQYVANNGRFDSIPATISVSVTSNNVQFSGVSTSLKPYRSTLSATEVQHLLAKSSWGSSALAEYAKTHTLDDTIEQMILGLGQTAQESVALALADELKDYTYKQYQVHVDGTKENFQSEQKWEWTSAAGRAYWLYHMRYGNGLKERMAFTLHDQFSVNMAAISSHISNHEFLKRHLDLLRSHALSEPDGSGAVQGFDDFVLKMTADGAMNIWLDGNTNTHSNPNQNYAREVMELFTLGARDPITNAMNYGEVDIPGAARAVSGFTYASTSVPMQFLDYQVPIDQPAKPEVLTLNYSRFEPTRWMPNPSAPQDIEVFIGRPYYIKSGLNYSGFLNHILYVHPGAPRFLAARLFSVFVHPNPSEAVVAELAQDLVRSQYDLRVALRKILKSEAMFSAAATEGCIVSPVDAFVRLMRSLDLPLVKNDANSDVHRELRLALEYSSQAPLAPPTVFGWKGCIGPRNGVVYNGKVWLVAQMLLERERQVVNILNRLHTLVASGKFGWNNLLPALNTVATPYPQNLPEAIVDSIALRLGLRPTPAERTIYVRYLTNVKVASSAAESDIRAQWEPSKTTFNSLVALKLPGLIQLMFNSTDYNLQ